MTAPDDSVPDSMPDSVADSAPDSVRDSMPDSVPDSTPDSVRDSMPDSVPDHGQPAPPAGPPSRPGRDPRPPEPMPPEPMPEPVPEPAPSSGPVPADRPAPPEAPEPPGDWPTLERMRFAVPAGLGTVMFGAGGVALLGAAQLFALRRSHDETLHAPPPLVALIAGLGAMWVVASVGLVRRAAWGRALAASLGLADLALTLLQAGGLAGLPVAGGSPFQRLGTDLLCAALALPWFGPAFRGPDAGPSIGKAYPAAVAWGTVVFLALAMAPGFATLAKAVSRDGRDLAESPLFRAASLLRESPPVAALVLPLLVLGPLLLVELRGRWAAVAVHLAGATTSMLVLNDLVNVAREVTRRAR